ncbi:MAG: hypothetical protein K1W15_13320 [Lachnospiraceae bacterium]
MNKDIEELCKAGIPVSATQGHGGISIMNGYKINHMLFTNKENFPKVLHALWQETRLCLSVFHPGIRTHFQLK